MRKHNTELQICLKTSHFDFSLFCIEGFDPEQKDFL